MYAKLTTEVELFTNNVLAGRVSVTGFAVYGHIRPVTTPGGKCSATTSSWKTTWMIT